MEYWDIYDKDRRCTGRTMRRGDLPAPGDYHIVVQVWVTDGNGRFMITQRAPGKPYPLRWEPTAGSVLAGETSEQAALREVKEEIGIDLDPKQGKRIGSFRYDDWVCPGFLDVYVFVRQFSENDVRMQEDEVVAAHWMDRKEIMERIASHEFIENNRMTYLEEVLSFQPDDAK